MTEIYFPDGQWHYAPEGYYRRLCVEQQRHALVGKKALIGHEWFECVRADDQMVVFRLSDSSEKIVSGDRIAQIKWQK